MFLNFIPFIRHLLVDASSHLLRHLYSHHETGFLIVAAAISWVILLGCLACMVYFIYLVITSVNAWRLMT